MAKSVVLVLFYMVVFMQFSQKFDNFFKEFVVTLTIEYHLYHERCTIFCGCIINDSVKIRKSDLLSQVELIFMLHVSPFGVKLSCFCRYFLCTDF